MIHLIAFRLTISKLLILSCLQLNMIQPSGSVVQQPTFVNLFSFAGNTSCFLKTPLLGMAKVLGSIGKAAEAIDAYQRVITILELSKGTETEELVLPLSGLGNLLLNEGKIYEAEAHFNRFVLCFPWTLIVYWFFDVD